MKSKYYVLKNIKTGKYYSRNTTDGRCRAKDIGESELYDEEWVKDTFEKYGGLSNNERFMEVEIKERGIYKP